MTLSQASLDFLLENSLTDSREWFNDHRAEYQELVVRPLAELVVKMTPGMLKIDGGFITEPRIDRTISRIHRDMRIAQNRSRGRYRPNCWIVFTRDKKLYNGLPAFFLEIEPAGFTYGMGYYQASTATMRVLRQMILDGEPAAMKAVEAYEAQNVLAIEGDSFKRPRYPRYPENLRVWLEKRNLSLIRESRDFDLLFSENLADSLLRHFRAIAPVYEFFFSSGGSPSPR